MRQRAIDVLRQRPLLHQAIGLPQIGIEHAVGAEAIADADDDADLAGRSRERHRGRKHRGIGLGAADDFKKPHDVRRTEEMQPDDILRPRRHCRDRIDIERRGVAGEDGAGLGDLVELHEDIALDRHVLEHGFDDQISVASFGEVSDPVMRCAARRQFRLRQRAFCARRVHRLHRYGRCPRARPPASFSTSVTGSPALANTMAMPLPMVPAPITPTAAMLRRGVEAPMPRTTDAAVKGGGGDSRWPLFCALMLLTPANLIRYCGLTGLDAGPSRSPRWFHKLSDSSTVQYPQLLTLWPLGP